MKIISILVFVLIFLINYGSCVLYKQLEKKSKELEVASVKLRPQIQAAIRNKLMEKERADEETNYHLGKELAEKMVRENKDTLIYLLNSSESNAMFDNQDYWSSYFKLAEQKGIVMKIPDENINRSNLEGYQDYMDSVINKRFGEKYLSKLKDKASLYRTDTLDFYDCDNYPNQTFTLNFFFTTDYFISEEEGTNELNLYGTLVSQRCPVLHASFYIDTDGKLSEIERGGYEKGMYYPNLTSEEEDQLWRMAKEKLRKYKKWKRCKSGSQFVTAKISARIFFGVDLLY